MSATSREVVYKRSCGSGIRLPALQLDQRLHHLLPAGLFQLVHELGAEAAPTHRPLIVLFFKNGSSKPEQGLSVGGDADHVAAPTDLAIEVATLLRCRRQAVHLLQNQLTPW
jgi:hypothetical protein